MPRIVPFRASRRSTRPCRRWPEATAATHPAAPPVVEIATYSGVLSWHADSRKSTERIDRRSSKASSAPRRRGLYTGVAVSAKESGKMGKYEDLSEALAQNPTETEASDRVGSQSESFSDEMPRASGVAPEFGEQSFDDQRCTAALGGHGLEELRTETRGFIFAAEQEAAHARAFRSLDPQRVLDPHARIPRVSRRASDPPRLPESAPDGARSASG